MPRPTLTQEIINEAVKLKKAGVNQKDIAAYVGVTAETMSRWLNHPKTDNQRQLAQALKKCEADRKAALLTIIYNSAVERTWQAAAWLLERQYPQEFARQERVQAEAKVEAAPRFFFDRSEAENG